MGEFAGTSRFDVRRRIGAGGMGVVFEAFDRERGMRVAIKTLSNLEPAALYRFKKEFRSLSDIAHKNLVRLHELVCENDEWFFTMDLITGVDFLTFVWGHGAGYRANPSLPIELNPTMPAEGAACDAGDTAESEPSLPRHSSIFDEEGPTSRITRTTELLRSAGATSSTAALSRLRASFNQLVAAVDAVHQAGKLHRDVKPANVLVEPNGRVVLLDFGIATDLEGDAAETTKALGTPAYMAPEQATPERLTEAADWYAVGVVLFEALTGRVPFTGTPMEMLVTKQWQTAPRASELATNVPADLDELCAMLLERHPGDRPTGPSIVARVGVSIVPPPPASSGGTLSMLPRDLVGRQTMLSTLHMALDAVRHGRPALVHVVGRSGMGKSTLVRHFLAEAERDPDVVVLSGRCYEHESVPYKGFDALVDGLSRYLASVPAHDCAAFVPRDARALARVFPVLDGVAAFANAPRQAVEVNDPHLIRMRAFGALRELLMRIADQRPIILHIDDLQWGDADSSALLAEITVLPEPPVILVIVSYRSEDVRTQPWLDALARTARASVAPRASSPISGPFTCKLTLDALDPQDAITVAASLLNVRKDDPRATEIARESGGSPFFIGELARYAQSTPIGSEARVLRLEDVVESRLRGLPSSALRVLEVVAVAGHPIDRAIALRTADLPPREGDAAIATLRLAHLLKGHGADRNRIEPYHDRIRETVLSTLSAETRRGLHGILADALVALGESDPDVLFAHFEASGKTERAAEYAEAAAARAAALLAFDRSAELYRRALDLTSKGSDRAQPLRILLAMSLARSGRGASAADAYMAAAENETGAARLDLRKKASEQLLFSGHIDRGIDLVRQVLSHEGMRLAPTPLRALLGLLFVRLLLLVRGTSFRERAEPDVPAAMLARIDTCNVVANGLAFVDTIQGRYFQARGALLALRAREPSRLVHALAGEAIFRAADGWRSLPRALALLAQADALLERAHVNDKRGTVEYARGMVHHITGQWLRARECFDRAGTMLDGLGESSFRVELDGAQSYCITVLVLLGRLQEASQRHAALRREAEDRGDLFLGTNLCIGFANQCWLFADQAALARTFASEAMARWSPRGVHLQHWHELLALTFIDLYDDEPERAAERIASKWVAMRRAMLMRIEITALQATYLRGASTLAVAARRPSRSRLLLGASERDARTLSSSGARWAMGMGALVAAGVRMVRGDSDRAARALEDAAASFDATSLALFAAVARRRLGRLKGGDEGRALVAAADAWMTRQGIRRPDRITAMLAPGFPSEDFDGRTNFDHAFH